MNDNIGCINPHGMYPFPKDRESCPDCQAIRAERAHGTRARYELHRLQKETPCEPCRDAMKLHFQERDARGLPLVSRLGYAHRPTGPFGLFQTGPHRTIRQVLGDYRAIIAEGLPYGWWRSPGTWVGLGCLGLLVGLLTALVCLYTGIVR
jgi:hypothetical protein